MKYEKALEKRLENCGNRKIVILGNDYFTDYIFESLKKMRYKDVLKGTVVEGKVQINSSEHIQKQSFFVLVACYKGHKDLIDAVQKEGFVYKKDYEAMNLGGWCDPLTAVDPLLGYCRAEGKIPQYKILGSKGYKILILGSSTSDIGVGGNENWVQFLEYGLQSKYNLTFYVGAVAGYHSGQELLKCIRDISAIKPQLVIQMSGINDVGEGTKMTKTHLSHKYTKRMWESIMQVENIIPDSMDMRNIKKVNYGISDVREDYEVFTSHMRMMNVICQEFGAHYMGCLEPFIAYADREEELEKLLINAEIDSSFCEKQMIFRDNVIMRLKSDWFMDLSTFFTGRRGMFLDWCHHSKQGAQLLGDFMSKKVEKMELNKLSMYKKENDTLLLTD